VDGEAEGVEALRLALRDLRVEIRSRLPEARQARSGAASETDGVALFDELRRRVATLGMSERSLAMDEFGMDAHAVGRMRPLLEFLLDRYWRVEVVGLDRVPERGPVIFVANHSGLLPWDSLALSHVIECGRVGLGRPRFLVADWLNGLPFLQPMLARLGGVRACRENVDRLLGSGRSVLAFPEGAKGATKIFRERYQLKRFGRGGVVRAALENRVPIVPVGVVGAEEAHPLLFKARAPGRMVGLPFLPVTPSFPLLGPLGLLPLPSKWVIEFGDPIDYAGDESREDEDALLLSRLTEELRERIHELLERGLARRDSTFG
jgi:1-acyl-sn-glycerol-3-phosphate acyltransferase